jgi:hypothetical protein
VAKVRFFVDVPPAFRSQVGERNVIADHPFAESRYTPVCYACVPWRRNRGRAWAMYDAVDGTSNAVEHVVRAIARALKHQAPLLTSSSMTTHCTNQNPGGDMNRRQVFEAASVVLLACGLASAQTITTFSIPGAGTGAGQGTGGFGINPQGTVVGSYLDDNNVYHGFQCVSGCGSLSTITKYDAPGAGTGANQGTISFSINPFGVVVGYYIDANSVAHGFATAPPFKKFATLNEPDAGQGAGQGTFAGNVNLGGEIAGYYVDANGVAHGFVTAPPYDTFTSYDPEGSVNTFSAIASALNTEGAVTGTYFDAAGALHAYVRAAGGKIDEYNVQGAGTGSGQGTSPSSIDDLGGSTGNYIDASGVNHGFLRRRFGGITTFNVSDAGTTSGQGTIPEGIDLLGEITGQYIDSNGVNHGFVRSPSGAITTFDAPGAGTGAGQGTLPATPNIFGVITGQYIDSNNVHYGFLRIP